MCMNTTISWKTCGGMFEKNIKVVLYHQVLGIGICEYWHASTASLLNAMTHVSLAHHILLCMNDTTCVWLTSLRWSEFVLAYAWTTSRYIPQSVVISLSTAGLLATPAAGHRATPLTDLAAGRQGRARLERTQVEFHSEDEIESTLL